MDDKQTESKRKLRVRITREQQAHAEIEAIWPDDGDITIVVPRGAKAKSPHIAGDTTTET